MRRQSATGPFFVRAFQALGTVMLLATVPHLASASSVASAYVMATNCGDLIDEGPSSASATNSGLITTGSCANQGAEASGFAGFGDPSGITLTMTSIPQRGVDGYAYLDDYLTFHVAGGGTAQVNVSMDGAWGGTYNDPTNAAFRVEFSLGLGGSGLYGGFATSNPVYNAGNPAYAAFSGGVVGPGALLGSYLFSTTWTVRDGVESGFFASLKAQASNGATAFINDPLFITLPAGVTFTSLSGSTYSPVPEPSTLLLVGIGLAGMARLRVRA